MIWSGPPQGNEIQSLSVLPALPRSSGKGDQLYGPASVLIVRSSRTIRRCSKVA